MRRQAAGPEIERLIQLLAKLPGLGPRSARRAALHMLVRRDQLLVPLAETFRIAAERVTVCGTCGNVDTTAPCAICRDAQRDRSVIIVVEDVSDLWALERAAALDAFYHVLGGTLSALDGRGPSDLNIDALITRAHDPAVREVVLALNATVEGQTTAHYLTDLLHGVPVGGELDYLDEGTITAAMRSRTRL